VYRLLTNRQRRLAEPWVARQAAIEARRDAVGVVHKLKQVACVKG
jgi:hypothetical protein